MTFASISLKTDVTHGRAEVVVNGQDLTSFCQQVLVDLAAHETPKIGLRLVGDVQLEGDGIVEVLVDAPGGQNIVEFLSAVDPEILERESLKFIEMDGGGGTEAMLNVLKRWASGGT